MITCDELKSAWHEGQRVRIEGRSPRGNPYGETMLGQGVAAWLAERNELALPTDTELHTSQDGAVNNDAA